MKYLSNGIYTPPQCRIMTLQVGKVLCASGPNSAPKVIYDESEDAYELS
jgi:hypothetical protein